MASAVLRSRRLAVAFNMIFSLFICLPAESSAVKASIESVGCGNISRKSSNCWLPRCTSWSSDMCNEADVGYGVTDHAAIYTAAHSQIHDQRHRDRNSAQNRQELRQSPPPLCGTLLDPPRFPTRDLQMYTRLQTQLFPHMQF
jgi:hypothetical protein